jgi:hypothetical protein
MTDPLDRLKATLSDRYAIERELGSGGPTLLCRRLREIALRIGLIIVPLSALTGCVSGPQGIANQPAPECRLMAELARFRQPSQPEVPVTVLRLR